MWWGHSLFYGDTPHIYKWGHTFFPRTHAQTHFIRFEKYCTQFFSLSFEQNKTFEIKKNILIFCERARLCFNGCVFRLNLLLPAPCYARPIDSSMCPVGHLSAVLEQVDGED